MFLLLLQRKILCVLSKFTVSFFYLVRSFLQLNKVILKHVESSMFTAVPWVFDSRFQNVWLCTFIILQIFATQEPYILPSCLSIFDPGEYGSFSVFLSLGSLTSKTMKTHIILCHRLVGCLALCDYLGFEKCLLLLVFKVVI